MLRVESRGVDRTRQRSHGRHGWSLVAVVVGAKGWRRQRSRDCGLGSRESRAVKDHLPDLGNSSPLSRVEFEDASQDSIKFQGDGENGPEELGVFHERAESAVLR